VNNFVYVNYIISHPKQIPKHTTKPAIWEINKYKRADELMMIGKLGCTCLSDPWVSSSSG
jgi:hypothetical protein